MPRPDVAALAKAGGIYIECRLGPSPSSGGTLPAGRARLLGRTPSHRSGFGLVVAAAAQAFFQVLARSTLRGEEPDLDVAVV